MQGYRTILFNLIMMLVGLLGWKVSPDLANHWLDVFVPVWGIGAILLRQVTSTPVGAAANAEVAQLLARLRTLVQDAAQGISKDDMADLTADVQTLLSHAKSTSVLSGKTGELADHILALIPQLEALAAAAPLNVVTGVISASLDTPAPVATPAVEAAVSAMAGDGSVPLSPAAPAQPSPVAIVEAAARTLAPIIPAL